MLSAMAVVYRLFVIPAEPAPHLLRGIAATEWSVQENPDDRDGFMDSRLHGNDCLIAKAYVLLNYLHSLRTLWQEFIDGQSRSDAFGNARRPPFHYSITPTLQCPYSLIIDNCSMIIGHFLPPEKALNFKILYTKLNSLIN
ncbi:MAG: hypothetical protein P8184_21385 [Calditrichia bacterium]